MIPEKVGMGQLLYKDGTPVDGSVEAAQEYLTYSKTHRYVLSSSFTEEMPDFYRSNMYRQVRMNSKKAVETISVKHIRQSKIKIIF